jgi:hypothetical protein
VPLIARVEAAASLLAHDSGAQIRITHLVELLTKVRDSSNGYLDKNAGAWLSLTEAELSRARGEGSTRAMARRVAADPRDRVRGARTLRRTPACGGCLRKSVTQPARRSSS